MSQHKEGPPIWWVGLVVISMLVASAAVADEGPQVDTTSSDFEFGEHALSEDAEFSEPERMRGPVDRRHETNALAGHGIGWSTGYIAPRGTVIVANRMLYGQRLGVSATDDLQLFAEGYLPLGSQTYAGLGGQWRVAGDDVWNLTMGLQARGRGTNFSPGTADGGLLAHAVVDVIGSDNTTWNIGVASHIPVFQSVEEVDHSACQTRNEWAESSCGTMTRESRWLPTSGYWTSLYGGIQHFLTDWLIIDVELFSGVSQGNFWMLESALDSGLAYDAERELVEQTKVEAGLGPLGLLTLGLGATWSYGGLAIQGSVYASNYGGDARLLPWFSAAYTF